MEKNYIKFSKYEDYVGKKILLNEENEISYQDTKGICPFRLILDFYSEPLVEEIEDGSEKIYEMSMFTGCGDMTIVVEEKFYHMIMDIIKYKKERREKSEREANAPVTCPKCGSTQIQAVPRKWSLLTGFMTNKIDRVCLKCKHRW